MSHSGPDGRPVQLEEWTFQRDELKRLLRRDAVGMGYTLFLPWSTYKPDVTQVQLKVAYLGSKGNPLYAINTMALNGQEKASVEHAGLRGGPHN